MDDKQRNIDYVNRILLMRKKRSRKETIPLSKVNRALENNYKDILNYLTDQLNKIIDEELYPAVDRISDNAALRPADIINDVFDTINLKSATVTIEAMKYAEKVINRMDADNRAKFVKSMKSILGIEMSSVVTSPEIQNQMQIITETNFNLIKSLTQEQLSKVKTTVLTNLSQGKFESSELREALLPLFKGNEKRADFIAKDQSHKIIASLNKVRNQEVGITHYKWRNSNDLRVRGNPSGYYPKSQYNHWTREGKVYAYDDNENPADGQPGMPIRCRCYAEAVIPEIYK